MISKFLCLFTCSMLYVLFFMFYLFFIYYLLPIFLYRYYLFDKLTVMCSYSCIFCAIYDIYQFIYETQGFECDAIRKSGAPIRFEKNYFISCFYMIYSICSFFLVFLKHFLVIKIMLSKKYKIVISSQQNNNYLPSHVTVF